jgi:hypothetical protein
MKKLLLVSAIVFGSASIASAQAVDAVQASSKTKPTAVNAKLVAKKQKEDAQANKLAGARPTVSNASSATAPAIQRPGTARKPKAKAVVAKKS